MGEFFRGWKRRTGCVTLLLAFVLAAGWVRSFNFADCFQLDSATFCSSGGRLYTIAEKPFEAHWKWPAWSDEKVALKEVDSALDEVTWKRRFIGFGYGEMAYSDVRIGIVHVHYWSIVVPLTLISAWLLLTNPRATPAATSSPLDIPT